MTFDKQDTKIMKGIAIILMLYHHLFAFPERIKYDYISLFNYNQKTISFFIGHFGKICVAIFIFLGGYGTYIVYKNNTKELIQKKITKLYINFWKVFLITIPISIILDKNIQINIQYLIENITAWKTTYNYEWWFILSYAILILLSPLFIKGINKNKNLTQALVIIITINFLIVFGYPFIMENKLFDSFRTTTLYQNLTNTIYLVPSYLCGMIFAKYNILDKIKELNNNIYSILSILIIGIIFIIRRLLWAINIECIIVPIFICCIIILLPKKKQNIINKFFETIGEKSTNIWLVHTFFCYYWFQKLIFYPKISIGIVLLLLIMSYEASILIDKFYELMKKKQKRTI